MDHLMDAHEQLLSDLVAINSINPQLVPGGKGEAEIARYIANWSKEAGLEVHLEEPLPGRPNVVAIARGSGGGKSLMFNGHLDTVGVEGMPQAHQPQVNKGRLYGRGAYDMKAGLAACMLAVKNAKQKKLRGDVILTAVMDEEYAGLGTMEIAKRYRADVAIVAEFTETNLILAHKGFVWLDVETIGLAAHGSRPELGIDAIAKMGSMLVELEKLDQSLRSHPTHKWLGSGSLHASLINGGRELSSYADHCLLSIERRTLPGETPEMVEAEVQEIIQGLERSDPSFKARVRRGIDRAPMETPEDSPIVRIIKESAEKVLKHTPEIAGVPFWTDAATLWAAGIPSILFGPSGAGAHAIEEWVDLQSMKDCAEIYLETAIEFCK
jgi:acetylornithine deacetylase